MSYKNPYLINFQSIGNSTLGYISVAECFREIPFEIKRVYWTYFTPNNVERGNHAHKQLEQVIIPVSGNIQFELEDISGTKSNFFIDHPNIGLYIPPFHWRKIKFSHNAVMLCLSSLFYTEEDYLRDYTEFKKYAIVG